MGFLKAVLVWQSGEGGLQVNSIYKLFSTFSDILHTTSYILRDNPTLIICKNHVLHISIEANDISATTHVTQITTAGYQHLWST